MHILNVLNINKQSKAKDANKRLPPENSYIIFHIVKKTHIEHIFLTFLSVNEICKLSNINILFDFQL